MSANHLVMLVHGINTRARWTNQIKSALREADFVVEATSYGKFGVPRFLLPFRFLRRRAIERVARSIAAAKSKHAPTKISVISHSFGTYVISRIIAEHPEHKWERIIFCGSVVPDDFPLDQFFDRFRDPLLNEVGTRDFLPALAESTTWGYGSVGSHGYNAVGVETRWHNGARHSDFLNKTFCTKYWVPFLRNGEIVQADEPVEFPWYIRVITALPLRWLQPVAVVALLIFASCFIPGDQPAKRQDSQETRVNSFRINLPNENFSPGERFWSRPTHDRWVELYPNGLRSTFNLKARTSLHGCDGSIVLNQQSPKLELLIPDRGCEQMILRFRRRSEKWLDQILRTDLRWNDLAVMEEVN